MTGPRRVPSEAEIVEAARRLGVLDEHGRVPAGKRAQVAKALSVAAKETSEAKTFTTDTAKFAQRVGDLNQELSKHLGVHAREGVLAAVAPLLWREMKTENTGKVSRT